MTPARRNDIPIKTQVIAGTEAREIFWTAQEKGAVQEFSQVSRGIA